MINLILTIFLSSFIIITFKVIGILKLNEKQAITINYLTAVVCGYIFWQDAISPFIMISKDWFSIALITGVLFTVTFFLMSASAAVSGVAITAVASRMSVVIPVIAGFALFHDQLNALKTIGILLTIASFYLIFKPKEKLKISFKKIAIPAVLFLGIGINDSMMKYVEHHYLTNDLTVFLTVVFFTAFVVTISVFAIGMFKQKEKISGKSIIAGVVLGALNFGATYFIMKSMSSFPNSVLFPVVNVSIVALTALTGLIVFKEKLSPANWTGIILAGIAIIIISFA